MVTFRKHSIDWHLAKVEYAKASLSRDWKCCQLFLNWAEKRAMRIIKEIDKSNEKI